MRDRRHDRALAGACGCGRIGNNRCCRCTRSATYSPGKGIPRHRRFVNRGNEAVLRRVDCGTAKSATILRDERSESPYSRLPMRHSHRKASGVLTAMAMAISSLPVSAADPIEVNWNQVCRVANGRELIVTAATGETTEGYCLAIKIDEIAVTTADHKVVKIARSTLSRIDMRRAKGH